MNPTKLKLTNPTDDELEAAVAEYVCGCSGVCDGMMRLPDAKMGGNVFESWKRIPDFATSAAAVLPLLEKWKATHPLSNEGCHIARYPGEWVVSLPADSWDDPAYQGQSPTFPRAACIALLRANGIEVEVTP